MDMNQYLDIFIDETREHLQDLNEQILELEKDPSNSDTINDIFRAAHSLKGMSGTMGYKRMQRLTHDLENVFSEIRNGKMTANASLVDILFRGLDALENYLANIQADADEGTEDNEDIIKDLNALLEAGVDSASAPVVGTEVKEVYATEQNSIVQLADFENYAVQEAVKDGSQAYAITVKISETCVLKSARAFLVFRNLEEIGTIIKSDPSVESIEADEFDFEFTLVIITQKSMEEIKKCCFDVSEITDVVVAPVVPTATEEPKEMEQVTESAADKAKKESVKNKAANTKVVASRSVRVDIEKLDVLMNLVSELIIAKNGIVAVNTTGKDSVNGIQEHIEYLERVTTNLHESVMKVRMVPIESVVNRFPRMIRDLTKKLNKPMELYMTGEETEVDRTVIDEIADPLMHLLRNSADHGLESPEERVKVGKPEKGSIYLNAYQEGNNVVIEVGDDGGGININKVKTKAIEKGTITEEEAANMTDKDFIGLLFKPSFSTADQISDVSGRGVGLDVVKTKIESLGGEIEATTKQGEGSTFTIHLPLTLAILQALLVSLGDEKYAIPLSNIQTIEDIPVEEIKDVQGKKMINLRGTIIPLVTLTDLFDVPNAKQERKEITVVVVTKGSRSAGLIVDDLIGQQEIVIKSMGKYMEGNKLFSGATILGDGEVALILDINTLV